MSYSMSSLQRVLTTLEYREPDKVPLFLNLTHHGAKELGMSIKDYYSKAENVVNAQLIMREKYKSDCLNPFYYSALEVEAFGGEVIFSEDCPPSSGEPIIKKKEDILKLMLPSVKDTKCLIRKLETIASLRKLAGPEVPIMGCVTSPCALPIMQMGFEKYLELIYEEPELFNYLMEINENFCVQWAKAQLQAGSNVICFSDPFVSQSIIPRELYAKIGLPSAKRTLKRINAISCIGLSSCACEKSLDLIREIGANMVTVGLNEDIGEVKEKTNKKLAVCGNLNGITMRNWTRTETEENIKIIIKKAGIGGGLIISDSAGEIPYQVEEATLLEISEAVNKWGKYPLDWIE